MRAALGVVLGALCAAAIACGGMQAKSTPTTARSPVPGTQGASDAHAEIEALDREITEELALAHIPPPVLSACTGEACAEAMSQPFATPTTRDPDCRPARSDRCSNACTLATSICDNQRRICELARSLTGDDWAANKCETARASCKAAHDSCCTCVP
jgi:hypothetical protein